LEDEVPTFLSLFSPVGLFLVSLVVTFFLATLGSSVSEPESSEL